MNAIPSVKTWIITLEDKRKFEVLAPTKFLAKLGFRQDYIQYWGQGIKSIGLKRK
jgi:hypothetical protein